MGSFLCYIWCFMLAKIYYELPKNSPPQIFSCLIKTIFSLEFYLPIPINWLYLLEINWFNSIFLGFQLILIVFHNRGQFFLCKKRCLRIISYNFFGLSWIVMVILGKTWFTNQALKQAVIHRNPSIRSRVIRKIQNVFHNRELSPTFWV